MEYLLIAKAWAALAVFTLFLVLYKDLEYILARRYRWRNYVILIVGTLGGPVTWVVLLAGWLRGRSMRKELDDANDLKVKGALRHGQQIQIGNERFKAYRTGKNITLKLIEGT